MENLLRENSINKMIIIMTIITKHQQFIITNKIFTKFKMRGLDFVGSNSEQSSIFR